MIELRPIILINGILLATLGSTMMIPAFFDLLAQDDDWMIFVASAGITLFAGGAMALANRGMAPSELSTRQAFLLTTSAWVLITTFASLPFIWSELKLSPTDAFFEAMSGVTTTGATVLTNLDDGTPPGILVWRALLQWLGGIGIIVMGIAVLPMLRIGGMQLFRLESSDNSDKILPRAGQIAGSIMLLYLGLTVVCVVCYQIAGMDPFNALTHAMTTIATGGFSTRDTSIGAFGRAEIEYVAIAFMIVASLPFLVLIQALRGKLIVLVRDVQVRWFFGILAVAVLAAFASHAPVSAVPIGDVLTAQAPVSADEQGSLDGFVAAAPLPASRRTSDIAPDAANGSSLAGDGQAGGELQVADGHSADVPEADKAPPDAFRTTLFNVVSIMTGTGYVTLHTGGYDAWGGGNSGFGAMLFLAIMFVGGCAGSTSCGVKVFRFYVLFTTLKERVLTFAQPNRIVV